jgi:anti-sigma regulatory factor (Ser/Thr protein kinase)
MRAHRGGPLSAAAIVLLALVIVVGLVAVTIVGPVLVVVGLALIALVAGLSSRIRPPPRQHGDQGARPFPDEDDAPDFDGRTVAEPSGRQWIVQWDSDPPPNVVPFAREQLTQALADWGLVGEAGEPTQLVVTELLSNAIDHAHAPIRLTVSFPGESVRVEVHDAAPEPPRQQPRDPERLRGRGLQMVDALSSQWGWTDDAAGKTVWADVTIGWPSD